MNTSLIPRELIEGLGQTATYEGLEGIGEENGAKPELQWIQTHLSHVFLVGQRVFKLHKSVQLPFADFSTREARNQDALSELRLGQRISPDVYLGLIPVQLADGVTRMGELTDEADPSHEHLLVMRRLPEGLDALSRVEQGTLDREQIIAVADRVAALHGDERSQAVGPKSRAAELARVSTPMWDTVDSLTRNLGESAVAGYRKRLELRLGVADAVIERRRREGRFVDGHGDLHLQHVWFEGDGEVTLIDGLAFSDELRLGDPAAEVAFLAMDLRYRRRSDLAEAFLARYAEMTDDFGLYDIVDLYMSHRAAIRAKVAALAASDPSIPEAQRRDAEQSAVRHLTLAEELLLPVSTGTLTLVCGSIGCGKSTVAADLGEELNAVVIRSDVVRRKLPGFRPGTGSAPNAGAYSTDARDAVYRALLERARPPLCAGRNVVLDASFDRRMMREEAWTFAQEHAASAFLVEVRASPAVVRERLRRRAQAGTDASEAGPELLAMSLERFEKPVEWPSDRKQALSTDDDLWPMEILALATRIDQRRKQTSVADQRTEHLAEWRVVVNTEVEKLKQIRDELEVQVELAGMEAKDRWRDLDRRWRHLEQQARRIRNTLQEDAEEIGGTARELAHELRQGFEHLRQQL